MEGENVLGAEQSVASSSLLGESHTLIGTGIEAKKATDAKAEYQKNIDLIIKGNEEKEALVKVLKLVKALVLNFKGLLLKMRQAMKAMQELESLFNQQHLSF
ncbi:uncharacterized protein FTOL_13666 [Fusarium torulosum]|uniref:Uncharacterized protein n=1 Tax=Fusarium torulosum TaxID=33205 RepID=A0AAE8SQ28_9HYPO|nr:uncharacterized protein FTOL_13666 [Fusarium torulosum]